MSQRLFARFQFHTKSQPVKTNGDRQTCEQIKREKMTETKSYEDKQIDNHMHRMMATQESRRLSNAMLLTLRLQWC